MLRFVRQAVVAHLERRVSLEDCPHGANFMVQRWLADGTPEVAAVDHDHAVVDASPLQLWRTNSGTLPGSPTWCALCCCRPRLKS